jgi:hypothetical protein
MPTNARLIDYIKSISLGNDGAVSLLNEKIIISSKIFWNKNK